MPVYFVVAATAKEPSRYGEYLDLVAPIVARHGGRYLARGGAIRRMGAWAPERIAIIEFPSAAHVDAWLGSPEYQAIAPLRTQGADASAILVEGVGTCGSPTPGRADRP